MESFREKFAGRSLTCRRRVARGALGPVLARAKTYRLSFGEALPARAGLSVTFPVSVPDVAAPAAAADPGLFSAEGGTWPPCCAGPLATVLPLPDARDLASAMLFLTDSANSVSAGGTSTNNLSQYAAASLYLLRSNSAVPANASALGFCGSRRSALPISSRGFPIRLPLFVIATMSA